MARPTATYRLQFREGMDFARAAALAPYLKALGVSHLYASPIFEAVPGSTHGYDIASYGKIEADLGGEEGLKALGEALRREGLELIVDFVPNHMGASPFNAWWCSVLEWGERSPYAHYFDIDWTAPKLLIPALGEPYGLVLEHGGFGLELDPKDGGINFVSGGLKLPMSPPSYAGLLATVSDGAFEDLANRFAISTPETAHALRADLAERLQDPALLEGLRQALAEACRDPDIMHQLHEAQIWRLAYWRAARETLTYRRFFEVTDLVGVRMEQPSVFDDSHRLILQLVEQGMLQGLRLDHVDGLADPLGYFRHLRAALQEAGASPDFPVLVEKILEEDEQLRRDWPVDGTTGYEFARYLAELLTEPEGEEALTLAYTDFVGETYDYADLLLRTKRHIFVRNLAGELDVLTGLAHQLAQSDLVTRDFGRDTLRRAIIEMAAALPVYRTYVDVEGPREEDEALIAEATEAAKHSREIEDELAIDFIARIWRLDLEDPAARAEALTFATRLQQTTGPLMAKAVEDTLFYRYNRLIALNEVGGSPDIFGSSLEEFHRVMAQRLERQPSGLSTTATHDTKRGEDARARLYAISEQPESWGSATDRLAAVNAGALTHIDEEPAPSRIDQWMFYQALAGAWPFGLDIEDRGAMTELADRMTAFMLKAIREAKVQTSWTGQNQPYEEAVERFVRHLLDAGKSADFLQDFLREHRRLAQAGALNSLAQTLLKLTAPGIPDIYQGAELWDLSLVDPDNRRPVDFELRQAMLRRLEDASAGELLADWQSGAAKLAIVEKTLKLRAEHPELFAEGAYAPVMIEGAKKGGALAFLRSTASLACLTVVPVRASRSLSPEGLPQVDPGSWQDTKLSLPEAWSGRNWRNLLTGESFAPGDGMSLEDLLRAFPVALLTAEKS